MSGLGFVFGFGFRFEFTLTQEVVRCKDSVPRGEHLQTSTLPGTHARQGGRLGCSP